MVTGTGRGTTAAVLKGRRVKLPIPGWKDLTIAAATVALDVLLFSELVVSDNVSDNPALNIPAHITVAAALVGMLLLAFRAKFPLGVVLALTVHAAVSSSMAGYGSLLPLCVALATVMARRDRGTSIFAFVAALVAVPFWVEFNRRTASEPMSIRVLLLVGLAHVVILAIAAGIGRWQHTAQQLREATAREAVTQERLRLARELHDVVAHTVTLMVLQAAGARRVLSTDPVLAESALGVVEEAGARAMEELRGLLTVLRTNPAPATEVMPMAAHGMQDLNALLTSVRETGVGVELEVEGVPAQLDPAADLAAYRVVQEALTNVTKHCGAGARARVHVQWGSRAATISVRDDGCGDRALAVGDFSTGHGLRGLKERMASVGGRLETGPLPGGGFGVTATLPVSRRVKTGPARRS